MTPKGGGLVRSVLDVTSVTRELEVSNIAGWLSIIYQKFRGGPLRVYFNFARDLKQPNYPINTSLADYQPILLQKFTRKPPSRQARLALAHHLWGSWGYPPSGVEGQRPHGGRRGQAPPRISINSYSLITLPIIFFLNNSKTNNATTTTAAPITAVV